MTTSNKGHESVATKRRGHSNGILLASVIVTTALAAASATVRAEALITFSFDDLSGTFSDLGGGTGTFSAVASDDIGPGTNGSVNRTVPLVGQADYNSGFVGGADPASVELAMDLSGITGVSAEGSGVLTITDAGGDTLTASVAGMWAPNGGSSVFSGLLGDVVLSDNGTLDGMFEGPSGGAFSMDFSDFGEQPFAGFRVELTLSGEWFTGGDFSGATSGLVGSVVPEPATWLLAGTCALFGASRRRRRR
ncbi:MAG: PEP-CTERM sorting domain-containing protein [Phycisphaerae bacterium]